MSGAQVQVGAADRARRDADDGVGCFLDLGVQHFANADRPDVVKTTAFISFASR